MAHPTPVHATLDDWIAREAIAFAIDSPATLHAGVAKVVASLGDSLELLAFGEALHGGADMLILRNRLFQRLVEAHGFSAIAIESSFPRGRVANDYVNGRGPAAYEAVQDTGFSHGFGRLAANRELVEWMRQYNADPGRRVKIHFYGFDMPAVVGGPASPRQVLHFVLDYLASIDTTSGQEHRARIDPLLGQDSDWEDPGAWFDPMNSVGRSPGATALRMATEELISELRTRRPELVAKSGEARYLEAVQYASVARELLNFYAVVALKPGQSPARSLGVRDALMADTLASIVARERGRGKVFAFAHNAHLQRGKAHVLIGADLCTWWPAGAHLTELFGPRYAVIGSAVGVSDANGIGQPEAGTLEARLTNIPGPALFIPTHHGQALPGSVIAALPTRSGSTQNPTYVPLTPPSLTDFDWLAVLHSTTAQ